jgi:hypothetical protein
MSGLQFKQQSALVNNLVQSTLEILENYSNPEIKNLLQEFNYFWIDYQN